MKSLWVNFGFFLIFVSVALSTCPNQCNGHGVCEKQRCVCDSFYQGSDCSVYDQSSLATEAAVPVASTDTATAWKYFTINKTNSDRSFVCRLSQNIEGDCDLHIQRYEVSTIDNNPARDRVSTKAVAKTKSKLDIKPAGVYYAGVRGTVGCNFAILMRHLHISREEWEDFSIEVDQLSVFSLTLKELATDGVVGVFVKFGEFPTLESYDYSTISTHQLNILDQEGYTGTIGVGVYGFSSIHFLLQWNIILEFRCCKKKHNFFCCPA